MRTKTKLILLMLIVFIGLMGCKKSNPSIVGTWTSTSDKVTIDSNNITIVDAIGISTNSSDTIAFYSNGKCALARYTSPFHSTYKLVGNIVFIVDTISAFQTQLSDTIISLTEHSLVLSLRSSSSYEISNNNSDTIFYTRHYTYNYSR